MGNESELKRAVVNAQAHESRPDDYVSLQQCTATLTELLEGLDATAITDAQMRKLAYLAGWVQVFLSVARQAPPVWPDTELGKQARVTLGKLESASEQLERLLELKPLG